MIRRIVAFAILAVFLTPFAVPAVERGHIFKTGVFQGISTEVYPKQSDDPNVVQREFKIFSLSGVKYVLGSPCPVFIRTKSGDAIHEANAKFSDLRVGDRVTVKILARTIEEIAIERWQQ